MDHQLVPRGCSPGPNGQQLCTSVMTKSNWTATGIGSGLGVFGALIAFILLFVWVERRKKRRQNANGDLEGVDEEEDDRLESNRVDLDVDTTPQGYYSEEYEVRNGITSRSGLQDNKLMLDLKSRPESTSLYSDKVSNSITYPPASISHKTNTSTQSSTSSNQTQSQDDSTKSTKRYSGSSLVTSPVQELLDPALPTSIPTPQADVEPNADYPSIPPPAYNENVSSKGPI